MSFWGLTGGQRWRKLIAMPHPIVIPKAEYEAIRKLRQSDPKLWTYARIARFYNVKRQRIFAICKEGRG